MSDPIVEIFLDNTDSSHPHADPEPGRGFSVALLAVFVMAVVVLLLTGGDRLPQVNESPSTTDGLAEGIGTTSIAPVESVEQDQLSADIATSDFSPGDGPLLGREVNFEVWLGGDSRVRRVDLDTGDIERLDVTGFPLFAAGDWVVIFEPSSGFSTIDRRAPGREPTPLDTAEDFAAFAFGPSRLPGFVWAVAVGPDDRGFAWQLISLTTGLPTRTVQTQSAHVTKISFGIEVVLPPVIDVRDDGIYFWSVNGFVRTVVGSLVAFDERRALIDGCALGVSESFCGLSWWDIDQQLPIAVPIPIGIHENNEILGDGSWMLTFTDGATEMDLVELFTSRTFDTQVRIEGRELDVAPDGRWAAISGGQGLRVMNLTSGEVTPIERVRPIGTTSSVVAVRQLFG